MGFTKQEAAAARAEAAQKTAAAERLSALEVERRGYVRRGKDAEVAAVDDEIAHWSHIAGIPVVAGPAAEADREETGTETAAGQDDTGQALETETPETETVVEETPAETATPKRRGRAAAIAKD